MIKRFGVGLSLLALVSIVSGCGNHQKTTAEPARADVALPVPAFAPGSTMEAIQKRGRMRVGVKFDQVGFGTKDAVTGQIEGFDVEIARLVAQGLFGGTRSDAATRIDFVEAVSKNREPFIQNGDVDIVVATYLINDTRKKVVDFAGPYFVNHGDVIIANDNSTVRSVTDLNGKTLCSSRGTTYPDSLSSKAPQAHIVELDSLAQCADALRQHRVDGVTGDKVALASLVQTSAKAFELVGMDYTDEPYGIGLKKGDDAFRNYLDTRLDEIVRNGDWQDAFVRTLGTLGLSTPSPPSIDRYPGAGSTAATTTSLSLSTGSSITSMPVSTTSVTTAPR